MKSPATKRDIITPALVIDLDRMECNIAKMASWFCRHQQQGGRAALRPHIKSHKSPVLAHKQLKAGQAVGITCAKLSEAMVMANAGIEDILIANQIVGPEKIRLSAGLAGHARLMVAVDNELNAGDLAEACRRAGSNLGVLIEIDVGLHRCGVRSVEDAVRLAEKVSTMRGLCLRGLQGFEGHLLNIRDKEQRRRQVRAGLAILAEAQDAFTQAGLHVEIVSGSGTGTFDIAAETGWLDEIQAGSYLFMDTNYMKVRGDFESALTLLTSIVSIPDNRTIVVDCGLKSLTNDEGAIPRPLGVSPIRAIELHEEHSIIHVRHVPKDFSVGDHMEIIPGHVCTTVNLHDQYYGARGDQVEVIWPISARGCFY